MADIDFELPTSRPPETVRLELERGIAARVGGASLTTRWEDQVLHLTARGAEGTIELLPGRIRVRARLSPPLSLFRMKVERELKSLLEQVAG